ncbi:unnamed protein product [Rotaria socialis]|uniref:Uncharacterized protein n=1 Tax=Rotaria socialis TaxID=392032 RepID=A0A821UX71_9BILA|nr:unnamed protein product [Rotaria socialis]CAF3414572.1 unnamed protein product [Rotaria socialis]CAF3488708.1 unnamed protein product [Rotaria socialis]CAF4553936.1 unnamed protein product [Rotaria socialis]CAF4564508.1 unnamed protein product [Rotaria socialis]
MQEIKKAEKQMILQQQLQSTISVSQVPSSQSCVSSMQISTDQTINTQTTPNINSAPASQSQNNAKRRITSESQRSVSTKKSRN